MNIYSIFILLALLVVYLIETLAKLLNLQSLNAELPEEFAGVYPPDTYAKSQLYNKVTTQFGFIDSLFGFMVLLCFWFLGGFNVLDIFIKGYNLHPLLNGILYIGVLVLANAVLSLPFDAYATFVIEESFGFNKTSLRIFALDRVKGLILGVILGIPVLAAVLSFFLWTGHWAWLYAWGGVSLFTLLISFVAPRWIMPIFNKFTPLGEGELRTAIFEYAESVHFPLKNVFVIDGSKRSAKSNAFFTGFGKNKRIALFDTLIEKHTVPELVAILAHEIGHYQKKHVMMNILIGILQYGVVFYLLSLILQSQGLFGAFGIKHPSIYTGLVIFGILYSPISFVLSILMNLFSRHNEFQADLFAVQTTRENEHLIGALKTLSITNLSNLTPHPFYVFIAYSHPPVLKRIETIRQVVN